MLTEINPLQYLFSPNHRLYAVFLISSVVIALVYLWFNPEQRKINLSKKLWLHPSAVLDYSYFFVSIVIKALLILPFLISAQTVLIAVYELLVACFGFQPPYVGHYWTVVILFTVTVFIVSDFSRYWLHRLFHTVPVLWRFHQVHHSAEVLNPMTFYRVHPLESLLFGLRYSIFVGGVTGVFVYFFGTHIQVVEVLGVNVFIFFFNLLGSNLRHSHIALQYPKWLECFFISPRQHQMHHSKQYGRKNYGGYLALWDWLFSTLSYSQKKDNLVLGLDATNQKKYQSIRQLLKNPFISSKN